MRWVQLCGSLSILWHCLSLGLEWKLTFSSPVATAEFSKFVAILRLRLPICKMSPYFASHWVAEGTHLIALHWFVHGCSENLKLTSLISPQKLEKYYWKPTKAYWGPLEQLSKYFGQVIPPLRIYSREMIRISGKHLHTKISIPVFIYNSKNYW